MPGMWQWHLKWHLSFLQACMCISLISAALASVMTLVRFLGAMCCFKVGSSEFYYTVHPYSTYYLKVNCRSPIFIVLITSMCTKIIWFCFSSKIQNSEMCHNEVIHFFNLEIIPVKNNCLCLMVPRFLGKSWLRDWLINNRKQPWKEYCVLHYIQCLSAQRKSWWGPKRHL